jgi:predicted RNase H-like HicB family nuclease
MQIVQDYILIIHSAEEGGFWAEIPALPGCFVQGETIDELLAEAPEIIEDYVNVIREDGDCPDGEAIVFATVRAASLTTSA